MPDPDPNPDPETPLPPPAVPTPPVTPPTPPAEPAAPAPPAVPAPTTDSDVDVMFKMAIEDLKAEVGDINLDALSLKDQMVALRAMKAAKAPPAGEKPPATKRPPAGTLPGENPKIPEYEYVPLCESNKRGSVFDQKLSEMKAVGSDVLSKLIGKR